MLQGVKRSVLGDGPFHSLDTRACGGWPGTVLHEGTLLLVDLETSFAGHIGEFIKEPNQPFKIPAQMFKRGLVKF